MVYECFNCDINSTLRHDIMVWYSLCLMRVYLLFNMILLVANTCMFVVMVSIYDGRTCMRVDGVIDEASL